MSPLVSVIIPTYNRGKYIEDTLNQVLRQTCKDLEIIIVDDGSTDDTAGILKEYVRRGLIVYHYQKNQGPAGARNSGVQAAHGQYIYFFDSDDMIEPDTIKTLLAEAQGSERADVIYGKAVFCHEETGVMLPTKYHYSQGLIFFDLLRKGNTISMGTALVKKICIGGFKFNDVFRPSEDFDLWLHLAYKGCRFKHIDKTVLKIRVHQTNLCGDRENIIAKTLLMLNDWEKRVPGDKRALAAVLLAQAKLLLLQGKYYACLAGLHKGFLLDKTNYQEVLLQLMKMIFMISGIYGLVFSRKLKSIYD